MIGIISLLTDEAYLEVQRVQRWLEEEYELPELAFFQPHITYLIGEGDGDREAVIERARALASGTDYYSGCQWVSAARGRATRCQGEVAASS